MKSSWLRKDVTSVSEVAIEEEDVDEADIWRAQSTWFPVNYEMAR